MKIRRSNRWMINDRGRWRNLPSSLDRRTPLEFGEYIGKTKGGNVKIKQADGRILYFKLNEVNKK